MVGANLERLVTAHDKAHLLVLLVLEQAHITRATLFPFFRILVKTEELGAADCQQILASDVHLKLHVLVFLVCLHFNLVLELDHRVELGVVLSLWVLLLFVRT